MTEANSSSKQIVADWFNPRDMCVLAESHSEFKQRTQGFRPYVRLEEYERLTRERDEAVRKRLNGITLYGNEMARLRAALERAADAFRQLSAVEELAAREALRGADETSKSLCPHCGKAEPHTHRLPGVPEPVIFPHD